MTDEQIRLYAIARCVIPPEVRVRTFAEPTVNGSYLYTLELEAWDQHRWFGVHHDTLVPGLFDDALIAEQVKRAVGHLRARPAQVK